MALNFGLLGQGPQFENVLAAFQQGREQRKETDVRNALAGYDRDPEGSISALTRADPVMGMKMRDRYTAEQAAARRKAVFQEADPEKQMAMARDTGDPEVLKVTQWIVDKADAKQVADLEKKTDISARMYFALQTAPPERVADLYAELRPTFEELGVPDFDPTDKALIDSRLAQATTIDQALALKKAAEPEAPRAPSGFEFADDGTLRPIKGGPGDPEYIGRTSGVRREAVTARPMPRAAGGGGAPKPNKSAPPPGFTERVR